MNGEAVHRFQEQVKQMILTNWEGFTQIITDDMIIIIQARTLRLQGKSYRQIANKLDITVPQVRTACKNIAVKK